MHDQNNCTIHWIFEFYNEFVTPLGHFIWNVDGQKMIRKVDEVKRHGIVIYINIHFPDIILNLKSSSWRKT